MTCQTGGSRIISWLGVRMFGLRNRMVRRIAECQRSMWHVAHYWLGPKYYEFLRSWYRLGYLPNIDVPQTFSEKVMYCKFHADMRHAVLLADKYAVREYVSQRVGEGYLNRLYVVGSDPQELSWEALPRQFVIKATHCGGGQGNIFVFDKERQELEKVQGTLHRMLEMNFGQYSNEHWYAQMPRRFVVEALMLDGQGRVPVDYKFFCFHGKCAYIQLDNERFGYHTRSFYDTDWRYLPFTVHRRQGIPREKPQKLAEMLRVAETLAQGHDFVRVDLYEVGGRVLFGEMTFAPGGGWVRFHPARMDLEFGKLWHIPGVKA